MIPSPKTARSAILTFFLIRRLRKIQNGMARVVKSVKTVKAPVEAPNDLLSTQRPPGVVASQLNWMGWQMSRQARHIATIRPPVKAMRTQEVIRTAGRVVVSRSRNTNTEILTRARIGL